MSGQNRQSYKRGSIPFLVVCLTLIVACEFWVLGCVSQEQQLTGSWLSHEITHPSPFFLETLSNDTQPTITLFFDPAGGFVWHDQEGVCHLGKYLIQDSVLVLTTPQGESITLGYALDEDRLRLKSPDGFMFEFRRASEDAGAEPCNR